ncbi:Ribosomal RNA small subunit methyltransferase A [Streptomyces glaucescens]
MRVLAGDFLAARPPRTPFSVAGNVPFSRTAAVVDWRLRAPALRDATLLTQLEYARKRTGDYGRWSLLTVRSWPRYEWRLVARIDRSRFSPVPRVDAGVVRIERRRTPLLDPAALEGWRMLVELVSPGWAALCTPRSAGPTPGGGWTRPSGRPGWTPGCWWGRWRRRAGCGCTRCLRPPNAVARDVSSRLVSVP